jgi:hypothetical protein
MRKKGYVTIFAIVVVLVLLVAGGIGLVRSFTNRQWFDTTFSFEHAIIALPGGRVVEGAVDSWTDFEDGDQIQVKIDGVTYLTHITNVVLVSK